MPCKRETVGCGDGALWTRKAERERTGSEGREKNRELQGKGAEGDTERGRASQAQKNREGGERQHTREGGGLDRDIDRETPRDRGGWREERKQKTSPSETG